MIAVFNDIVRDLCAFLPLPEARETAYWIIEETTGLTRTQLLTGGKVTKKIPNYKVILERIAKKEPIQYVFQHTVWCGLDLKVTPATLIPRPETAELVEEVEKLVNNSFSVVKNHSSLSLLDIGTGSGCIAIALKKRNPEWDIHAMDISEDALIVARENAAKNGVKVDFFQGDTFSDEMGVFDIIVSNPPYIMESEKKDMENRVLNYEPHSALFVPDDDPLLFYRRIAQIRKARLLAFEINRAMGQRLYDMFVEMGYGDIQLIRDSYGNDRILTARLDS